MLVTVKAYPALSQKYGEVVCMAGLRLDEQKPSLVRLYPAVDQRAEVTKKIKKYTIVDLAIEKTRTDQRPESYRPYLDTLRCGETVDTGTDRSWRPRWELLRDVAGRHTMCSLWAQQQVDGSSLGMIAVKEISDLTFEAGDEFSDKQGAIARAEAQPTLFRDEIPVLQPAPFKVKYHYRCMEPTCGGHHQTNVDWELGAAAMKWRNMYPEAELLAKLREAFLDKMSPETRDTYFFVGNQHQNPRGFLVLGVFYPPKGATGSPSQASESGLALRVARQRLAQAGEGRGVRQVMGASHP